MRNTKNIGFFSIGLALLILLGSHLQTLFIGQQKWDVESLIFNKLTQDSLHINNKLKSFDTHSPIIEDSPFAIEIFFEDSIKYWNEIAGQSIAKNYRRVSLWKNDGFTIQFGIDPQSFNASKWAQENYIFVLPANSENTTQVFRGIPLEVVQKPSKTQSYMRTFSWMLLLVGFLGLALRKTADLNHRQRKKSFFLVLVFSLLFKALHYWPFWMSLFEGFAGAKVINTTSVFTPNWIHLTINIWIFALLVFRGHIFLEGIEWIKKWKSISAILYGWFVVTAFTYFTHLCKGFVLHPSVHLDVDALMEFNHISFVLILNLIFYIIVLFQGAIVGNKILKTNDIKGSSFLGYSALGVVLGLIIYQFTHFLNVPWLMFLVFVVAFILMIDAYVESKEKKITYLIWWLFVFSSFIATVLFYFGLQKDIEERKHFVENYYSQPVDSLVKGMIEIQDSLVSSKFFNSVSQSDKTPILDYEDIKDYVYNILPTRYKDWPLILEMYDKNSGKSLFSHHFSDYYKTQSIYENGINSGKGVVFNPFENKYLRRFEIALSSAPNNSWFLYLILNNEKSIKREFSQKKYDFAIIQDQKISYKQEINYPISNDKLLRLAETTQIQSGYSMVVGQAQGQYKIVSWKKISGLIKPISLFSFIFTVAGLILLILSILNTRYNFLPETLALKIGSRTSLKAKIQLAIIGLILFTFFVIGVITVFYFKNMLEVQQNAQQRQINTSIYNNVMSLTNNLGDDEYALSFLNNKLKDIAFIHDRDITLYDAEGKIMSSTADNSNYIRVPFEKWSFNLNNQNTNYNEKVTQIVHLPITLQNQRPMAYIAIDHKSSKSNVNKLADFLSTILNAYIFLFLVAGALAITIANSITQPLSQLAEKLKKFKLGKTNEHLEWTSNDEIGELIKDYNNLTHELDKSVNLLAKTERDSAWREMAKQVAHEIKNPLTPMKLSIQYLERAHKENPEKASGLIPRISATLVEQIDNLSQIAGEFSNFATMPQATNEKVSLNEVVETIHDLFRKREDMDIKMNEPIDDLYVFADKNHLVRILNNLLKNAIQAIPDDKRGIIEIELTRKEYEAVIRISDNGVGIPPDKKDKVFTPNFTTKSSGTGLGLAISSNMIESFNGRIYFESEEGKGTDFYVAIPLMKLMDYNGNSERVSLD